MKQRFRIAWVFEDGKEGHFVTKTIEAARKLAKQKVDDEEVKYVYIEKIEFVECLKDEWY